MSSRVKHGRVRRFRKRQGGYFAATRLRLTRLFRDGNQGTVNSLQEELLTFILYQGCNWQSPHQRRTIRNGGRCATVRLSPGSARDGFIAYLSSTHADTVRGMTLSS